MNFVVVFTQFAVIYILFISGLIALKEDLDIGYYWREYDGNIPNDALPGGKDKTGKTTYIGQTEHGRCDSGIVVTGDIHEAEKIMKYEWGYKQQIARNMIQILCTRHPEQFEWIDTNSTEIYNITGRHLLCGGRERNFTIYIGKTITDNEILIGKVLVTNLPYQDGFYSTLNGKYLHIHDSYSILAYKPDTNLTIKIKNIGFTFFDIQKRQAHLSGATLYVVNNMLLTLSIILPFCVYFSRSIII